MVDFYALYISPSSSRRSKLSVHLRAQSKAKEPTLDEEESSPVAASPPPIYIKDVHAFKSTLQKSTAVRLTKDLVDFEIADEM
jgi:hypothetical protein